MIKILDSNFNRLGVIKNAISSNRLEEINGENILDFEAVLDQKLNDFIDENSIFELDNDWFDTAFLKKTENDDDTFTIEIESEHVSYRLNNPDYNVDFFTEIGTPSYILGKILEGTGFTIDTVEFYEDITYSVQEAKSRRQLLMEFVAYLGGELKVNKFNIGIVHRLGSTDTEPVIKDRNVKVISKTINKRNLDENGGPTVSYECTPIYLPGDSYSLGDNILLQQKDLGINENLRVISISRDVYDISNVTFQFANYTNGLESALYRIETQTIAKDQLYNGARIGPEYGFESVRNDKKARSYFRSDGMKFQSGDGTGENWKDRLYFDYDSDTDETVLVFDGKLTAQTIEAIKAAIDIVISNTIIVNNLTAKKGNIVDLTVDQLDSSDKVGNYKADPKITNDVNYIKIRDQIISWIVAKKKEEGTLEVYNRDGKQLYWADETMTEITEDETAYPIFTFDYDETEKLKIYFDENANNDPIIQMGVGFGKASDPELGRGYLIKDQQGILLKYKKADGNTLSLRLGENGIEMNPPILIFPDTSNESQIVASAETVLPGLEVDFRQSTKVAFDVQMDVTASEAMTLLVKARIDGEEHRRTVKYFSGAYKDGLCFNGIFDSVSTGSKSIDVTITPSVGSATIDIKEYRLMLTVRDATAKESDPWPEANVSDNLTVPNNLIIGETVAVAIQSSTSGSLASANVSESIEIFNTITDEVEVSVV